jgi:hypothetical protein
MKPRLKACKTTLTYLDGVPSSINELSEFAANRGEKKLTFVEGIFLPLELRKKLIEGMASAMAKDSDGSVMGDALTAFKYLEKKAKKGTP